MTNYASMTFENGECFLKGDLDFSNVVHVYQQSLSQFASSSPLVFNFAGLNTSNSAGLALMIEWLRQAKKFNKPIEFRDVSPKLQSIAKAAGLDSILLVLPIVEMT